MTTHTETDLSIESENRIEALGPDFVRGLADPAIYGANAWDQRRMLYKGLPHGLTPDEVTTIDTFVTLITGDEQPFYESPERNARRAVKHLGRAAFARGDNDTYGSAMSVLREKHGLLGKIAAFSLSREPHRL
jgi:hypothetical protein